MKEKNPAKPETPIYRDRKTIEHTTRGILPSNIGDGETVVRQLTATYDDGKPRDRQQATVDLYSALHETMKQMSGFALVAEPTVEVDKRGMWVMTARLKPMNRLARRHTESMKRKNNVKNLS